MARGGFILLLVICFLAYWGWQYYKGTQTKKEKSKDEHDSDGDPDVLRAYYERKIKEMEERVVMGIQQSTEQLEEYKEKLNKLNNLKK